MSSRSPVTQVSNRKSCPSTCECPSLRSHLERVVSRKQRRPSRGKQESEWFVGVTPFLQKSDRSFHDRSASRRRGENRTCSQRTRLMRPRWLRWPDPPHVPAVGDRAAADQGHEAKSPDEARERRNVCVAAGIVDQCRTQDRPFDSVPCASQHDPVFSLGEPSKQLSLFSDLAVSLGHDAGRAEYDDPLQRRTEDMGKRVRQQNGIGGTVEGRECREIQGVRLCQVTAKPVNICSALS